MPIRAIFFDAGNTLVFPNLDLTLAPLLTRGMRPSREKLQAAERAAKKELDSARLSGINGVDAKYWHVYYGHLLNSLGISDSGLLPELVLLARTSANWNRVLPGTGEPLAALRDRFRLGVISNSDGRIADLMADAGLAECFESFTDSGVVGYEKPHPAIFAAGLKSLDVDPAESMYVGDIFLVDYLGAQAAGMRPILMDASGAYEDKNLPRIESLEQLESILA